jgi:purine nucleoside phosphorylase
LILDYLDYQEEIECSLTKKGLAMKIGLIAGTGMGKVLTKSGFSCRQGIIKKSPFGGSVEYFTFEIKDVSLVMIDRHNNSGIALPPKRLNRKAYMHALGVELEVEGIGATSAVGTPFKEKGGLTQGSLVVPADAADYVNGYYTFEGEGFADPGLGAFYRPTDILFCPHFRQALEGGEHLSFDRFILANSIKRPAFETPFEMSLRIDDGVDLVGMPTAFPEALLAGEMSIPYAVLCGVSNVAPAKHNGSAVEEAMAQMLPIMKSRILNAVEWLSTHDHPHDCPCRLGREKSVFEMLGTPSS